MSLASDTRREAMLCSAVLVLPWCCTVILIQNMNLDTSIRVFLSPSIRHWQVSVRPKHQSLWCLLPVNLPFPTNLFWPTHSNVFLQALHGDAKASLEVVPIKISDIWELPMTLPSPTNGTWAQGYDLSHALPQLPQLHFCKQIFLNICEVLKAEKEILKMLERLIFWEKLATCSHHFPAVGNESPYFYWIPHWLHIFTPIFNHLVLWCFGGAWVSPPPISTQLPTPPPALWRSALVRHATHSKRSAGDLADLREQSPQNPIVVSKRVAKFKKDDFWQSLFHV